MHRVIHFEIPADDLGRALEFYRTVFGWDIRDSGTPGMEYYLITTGEGGIGINGALMQRSEQMAEGGANSYLCTIEVSDLDDFMERVSQNGGTLIREKVNIPGVGWFIYCKDTEGNTFGMLEPEQ